MKNKKRLTNPVMGAVAFAVSVAAITLAMAAEVPKGTGTTWVAPARAARKANPIPADATSIAQGKELFTSSCLPCHGPQGKGDGPAAISLDRNGTRVKPGNLSDPRMWQQTDGAIFWKMTEGNSPMPAFGETLKEEQRWALVNYVRTLAPRKVTISAK